ncbi:hypothetical protein [Saccharolobus islandicus]|uniref:Uncharacterized protein n=2 Tax=Saccharolobus islandicus TaxID=43080 RepID=C3MWP5_SACI4|nr:hypothetical protein [Sulfolobus islandicus]ACP38345.1 hypothetical protein M1425_1597 [Sulfolobus islandicus M.14.25]
MIGKYVDLHQVGNHMALIGDQSAFTCIESLLSLGDCLLTTSEAIDLCPLCAQVVTCIPACVDIFTVPVCLACEATGLGGCIVCLIAAYVCYDAALAVRNNCL